MSEPFFQVSIPYRLQSWANTYQYHYARAARVKKEKAMVGLALLSASNARMVFSEVNHETRSISFRGEKPDLTTTGQVHFTRVAPKELDSDNLASAFKAIRDAVAKFIGVSDAPSGGINWTYSQEKSKVYGVRIEFLKGAE